MEPNPRMGDWCGCCARCQPFLRDRHRSRSVVTRSGSLPTVDPWALSARTAPSVSTRIQICPNSRLQHSPPASPPDAPHSSCGLPFTSNAPRRTYTELLLLSVDVLHTFESRSQDARPNAAQYRPSALSPPSMCTSRQFPIQLPWHAWHCRTASRSACFRADATPGVRSSSFGARTPYERWRKRGGP